MRLSTKFVLRDFAMYWACFVPIRYAPALPCITHLLICATIIITEAIMSRGKHIEEKVHAALASAREAPRRPLPEKEADTLALQAVHRAREERGRKTEEPAPSKEEIRRWVAEREQRRAASNT
jgi:sirohydrochlorin ferrochelatase